MSRARHTAKPHPSAAAQAESGLRALAAALARLRQGAPSSEPGGPPQPVSAWERAAEQRLTVIEKQLTNQNRLLLLTLISIVADVALGLTK